MSTSYFGQRRFVTVKDIKDFMKYAGEMNFTKDQVIKELIRCLPITISHKETYEQLQIGDIFYYNEHKKP